MKLFYSPGACSLAVHMLRRAMVRRIAVQVSMDREGLRIPFAEVA